MILNRNKNYFVGDQIKVMDQDSEFIEKVGYVVNSTVVEGELVFTVWFKTDNVVADFSALQIKLAHRFCKACFEAIADYTPADEEQSGEVVTPEGPTEEDNF